MSKDHLGRLLRRWFIDKTSRGSILRTGAGTLTVKAGGVVLTTAVSLMLARGLGSDGYGVYSYVFALVMLLAVPAQFGLPVLVIRETVVAQAKQEWGKMRGVWSWSNMVGASLAAAIVVVGLVAVWLGSERLTHAESWTFIFGLLLVPLIVLGNLRGASLSGLRHVVTGSMPEIILRPGFLLLLVVAAAGAGAPVTSPVVAMVLHLIAAGGAFLLGAWLLFRVRPASVRTRPVFESAKWIRASLPLGLVAGAQVLNGYADILVLGLFAPASEVGVYRATVQAAALVAFPLSAANMAIAPQFARLHAVGDTRRLQRLAVLSARMTLAGALPIVLAFSLWGRPVLSILFGEEFSGGYGPLLILLIGQTINVAMGSVAYLLNMTGHEGETARAVALSAAVSLALSFALAPRFGMVGVAVAASVALAVWNLRLWYAVRRRLGIDCAAFAKVLSPDTT